MSEDQARAENQPRDALEPWGEWYEFRLADGSLHCNHHAAEFCSRRAEDHERFQLYRSRTALVPMNPAPPDHLGGYDLTDDEAAEVVRLSFPEG